VLMLMPKPSLLLKTSRVKSMHVYTGSVTGSVCYKNMLAIFSQRARPPDLAVFIKSSNLVYYELHSATLACSYM